MQIIENLEVIISLICGVCSIIMFFLAKNEKDKCMKIKNEIDQSIQIFYEKSKIESKDEFNIKHVKTFDNRKVIK